MNRQQAKGIANPAMPISENGTQKNICGHYRKESKKSVVRYHRESTINPGLSGSNTSVQPREEPVQRKLSTADKS
jgi:hypothetical protein